MTTLHLEGTDLHASAIPLDGSWWFACATAREDVTDDDIAGATGGWPNLEVPGCWTMQGFDRPQYTNVQMPFPGPPPDVPDENPTGVYRRTSPCRA